MDRMILSANANLNNLRNKLRIDPPKLINFIDFYIDYISYNICNIRDV